jgi:hypothetical protein
MRLILQPFTFNVHPTLWSDLVNKPKLETHSYLFNRRYAAEFYTCKLNEHYSIKAVTGCVLALLSRMLKNPGNTVKKACSANLSTYLLANIGNF